MKALILLARNTGMLFALFSALPFVSRGESAAVFENKTKSTADIRVIGPDTVSASVQSNATKRLELKGGEYYFKIRFLSVDSPRYAVGPYFSCLYRHYLVVFHWLG